MSSFQQTNIISFSENYYCGKKNKYNFEYKSEKTGYPQLWTTKSKAPALLDSPKMHFPNALLPYDFEKFPSAQNDVYIITPLNNIYKVF